VWGKGEAASLFLLNIASQGSYHDPPSIPPLLRVAPALPLPPPSPLFPSFLPTSSLPLSTITTLPFCPFTKAAAKAQPAGPAPIKMYFGAAVVVVVAEEEEAEVEEAEGGGWRGMMRAGWIGRSARMETATEALNALRLSQGAPCIYTTTPVLIRVTCV